MCNQERKQMFLYNFCLLRIATTSNWLEEQVWGEHLSSRRRRRRRRRSTRRAGEGGGGEGGALVEHEKEDRRGHLSPRKTLNLRLRVWIWSPPIASASWLNALTSTLVSADATCDVSKKNIESFFLVWIGSQQCRLIEFPATLNLCYIATLNLCYIATLKLCYIFATYLLHCYIATLNLCYIATYLLHCYIATLKLCYIFTTLLHCYPPLRN